MLHQVIVCAYFCSGSNNTKQSKTDQLTVELNSYNLSHFQPDKQAQEKHKAIMELSNFENQKILLDKLPTAQITTKCTYQDATHNQTGTRHSWHTRKCGGQVNEHHQCNEPTLTSQHPQYLAGCPWAVRRCERSCKVHVLILLRKGNIFLRELHSNQQTIHFWNKLINSIILQTRQYCNKTISTHLYTRLMNA